MESNGDEHERVMRFPTDITMVSSLLEAVRGHVLAHTMDLNYLTLIVNIGMAEQRRLRVTANVSTPLMSELSTETVESYGSETSDNSHPWSTWHVKYHLSSCDIFWYMYALVPYICV